MKIACVTPDNKLDFLCATILEGLQELNVELVVSDPGNGIVRRAMNDGDFIREAKTCDAMLVFFGKVRDNRPARRYLIDEVGLPRERMAYLDGSEWRADGWHTAEQVETSLKDPKARRGSPWLDEDMLQRCAFYFKRETFSDDLDRGVMPLPFAMRARHVQSGISVKDVDVLCSFPQVRTGMRRRLVEMVERFRDTMTASLNVVVKHDMSVDEYRDCLRRSRVVVDSWGAGETCDRFWDAVGAKACVLYQRYNIEFPRPFVDFEHAVSFADETEFSNRLHRLVYTGDDAIEIGERGFAHAVEHHTAKNRAETILKHVFG